MKWLRVSKSVIFRIVKRYRQTGEYSTRRKGPRRKRVSTERDDRFIIYSLLKYRTSSSSNRTKTI